jgi:hypothetical protein
MDPSVLTVYKCPYDKQRLGKNYDGGYIIAVVPDAKYQILLAGGISNDISFEVDFVNKYDVKCLAFDGTINKLPAENNKIEFIKKNIGFNNTEQLTNLHDIIDSNDNIFVKMDIEGGEIPWIKSLSDTQINKFDQIVMEFHTPFSINEIDIFDKLNKNHILVHFHGNNCCGTREHRGVIIPNIFECTYLHRKFFINPPQLNIESIPSNLDMKNTNRPEIYIDYPPFVNKNGQYNLDIKLVFLKLSDELKDIKVSLNKDNIDLKEKQTLQNKYALIYKEYKKYKIDIKNIK